MAHDKKQAQTAQTELVNQPNIDQDPVNVGNPDAGNIPQPDNMLVPGEVANQLEFGEFDDSAVTDFLLNVLAPFSASSSELSPEELVKRIKIIFDSEMGSAQFLGKLKERVEFFKENLPEQAAPTVDQTIDSVMNEADVVADNIRQSNNPIRNVASTLLLLSASLNNARRENKRALLRVAHFSKLVARHQQTVKEAEQVALKALATSEAAEKLSRQLLAEKTVGLRLGRINETIDFEIQLGLIETKERQKRISELLALDEESFVNLVRRIKNAAAKIAPLADSNPLAGKLLGLIPTPRNEEGFDDKERSMSKFWS